MLAGFVISVLLFKREIITQRITWFAILLFVLIIGPNLYWQITNGFPVLRHVSELYETQLNQQSFIKELTTLILFLNPLTFVFWLPALVIVPFLPRFKEQRLPVFTLLLAGLLLLFSKGKSYYFFPIILSLTAIGAVFFEYLLRNKKWIGYLYLFFLGAVGLYLLPHGIPVLKLDKYVQVYGIGANSDNKTPLNFENYYSRENWNRILNSISDCYNELSAEEQQKCYIWGKHYSMAGNTNVYAQKYALPQAFSFHSSCYTWVPEFNKDIVVIAIGESNIDHQYWEQYFDDVEEVDVIENPYASERNWYEYRIYICRQIKYNSDELKKMLKTKYFNPKNHLL